MAVKKRRREESIEDYLRAMYSTHPDLASDVAALGDAGYTKLEELADLSYMDLCSWMSGPLLSMALRHFVNVRDVSFACSRTMTLECTTQLVTLRAENHIPELPQNFSPMFPEMEEPVDTSSPSAVEDQADEMHDVKEALNQLPAPPATGLLQVPLYRFTTPKSLKTLQGIWGAAGSSSILERPCYMAVRDQVERLWDAGALAVLLLGVSGIGKTGFIITTLLKLLGERKAVVFQTKGATRYFFEPQSSAEESCGVIGRDYECVALKDESLLADSEVFYLVDGKLSEVPHFGCRSLLAATPTLTNFQEYDKDGRSNQVFLPVWSAAEIALAWQEIFDPALPHVQMLRGEAQWLQARKSLTLDVVKERYASWGGTARFVLEKPHIDLDTIVRGLESIQRTVEAMGRQIAGGDHPSHKLVHQRVMQGYNQYEYMFASPCLVRVATEKLRESTSGELRPFLNFKGLAAHGVNGCKGYVFQHEFMFLTQKPGPRTFTVRQVHEDIGQSSQDEVRVFEFGEVVRVCKIENLAQPWPVNRMIWPDSPVDETVDAMRITQPTPQDSPELELFQATLSSARHAHGLKYSAVLKVMQQSGIPPSRTRVYIVTTSELYPAAGYQNWRKPRKLVVRCQRIISKLAGIGQFVMDSGI